jgi:hypothetical protein
MQIIDVFVLLLVGRWAEERVCHLPIALCRRTVRSPVCSRVKHTFITERMSSLQSVGIERLNNTVYYFDLKLFHSNLLLLIFKIQLFHYTFF